MQSINTSKTLTPTSLSSIWHYLEDYREREILPRVKLAELALLESKLAAPGTEGKGWDIIKPIPLGPPAPPAFPFGAFAGVGRKNMGNPEVVKEVLTPVSVQPDIFGGDLSLGVTQELVQLVREGKVDPKVLVFAKHFRAQETNYDSIVDSYLNPQSPIEMGPKANEDPTL
jgi:hypothetical protein